MCEGARLCVLCPLLRVHDDNAPALHARLHGLRRGVLLLALNVAQLLGEAVVLLGPGPARHGLRGCHVPTLRLHHVVKLGDLQGGRA